jgi:hypothetical protein
MAEDAQGVRSSFQSVSALLDNPQPNLPLLLSQTGLAIKKLSGQFGKHPVVQADLIDLGQAILNLRHRFSPGGEAL